MIQPNNPNLDKYAQRASSQIDQICARMKVPREVGQDLVKLALFDIILYIGNQLASIHSTSAYTQQITVDQWLLRKAVGA